MSTKHLTSGLLLLTLASAVTTVACSSVPSGNQFSLRPVSVGTSQNVTVAGVLTGRVLAPATLISNNSAGLISNNSAGLISNNSAGIISNNSAGIISKFGLLAVKQNPLANTEVFLADAAGNPIPGLPSTVTDASGQYTFDSVPAGYTLMVVARAKTKDGDKAANLQTIVKTSKDGANADLSAASTLVTAYVAQGKQGSLGKFSPADFDAAVNTTASNLTDDTLPDFSQASAVVAKMESLSETVTALRTQLSGLQKELAQASATIEDLKRELEELRRQKAAATPTPAPTPSGAPSTTPSYVPASAAPTPTPDPFDRRNFAISVGGAPTALALDGGGNLWVATGEKLLKLNTTVAAPVPTDMAAGGTVNALGADTQGDIVAGDHTGKLTRFKADGTKETIANLGENILDLVVDKDRNVWSTTASKAIKVSHAGSHIGSYALRATEATHAAVSLDKNGDALVQGLSSLHVDKLAAATGELLWWGRSSFTYDPATAPAPAFAGIGGDSTGHVWISSYLSNQVIKVTSENEAAGTFSVPGSPGALAVDRSDNVWVALVNTDKVVKLSNTGTLLATYHVGARPADLLIAPGGRVWVSHNGSGSVTFIDP